MPERTETDENPLAACELALAALADEVDQLAAEVGELEERLNAPAHPRAVASRGEAGCSQEV